MSEPENSFKFKNLPWGWILLGVTLWFLFPWIYSVLFSVIIKNPEYYGDRFGAVGDIYGSLNTLISSMVLCAVAYSTTLQVKELRLARKTYTDQLNESRYSNFTTNFYALLNHKNQNYKNLDEKNKFGKIVDSQEIFTQISKEFFNLNKGKWADKKFDQIDVKREFRSFVHNRVRSTLYIKLEAHFSIYADLNSLIQSSELSNIDKHFYLRLIANSMNIDEQISLVWLSSFNKELKEGLLGSGLIKVGCYLDIINFIMYFHDKSLFTNNILLSHWERNEKTPA